MASYTRKNMGMLRNQIKFSLRNLIRQKGYATVNIIGLATGMALFLLISLFVWRELQTDRFHSKIDRIYRVETQQYSVTASMVSELVSACFPDALEICRMDKGHPNVLARVDEKMLAIENLWYADSSFFRIFDFDLLQGNPATALSLPYSIVLSQTEAQKLFQDQPPLGQMVTINNRHKYEVTGIMIDPPSNSSIDASAIIPFHALAHVRGSNEVLSDWNNWNYYSFVLLPVEHDPIALNKKFELAMDRAVEQRLGFPDAKVGFLLRPMSDIYFNRNIPADGFDKGNKDFILVYSAIALFILFIAVINFINLSTAMSFRRAKETGLKKVLGSSRAMLIRQFLTESVLISSLALLLALVLFEILLPEFNKLTLSGLAFKVREFPLIIILLVVFAVVIGLLSGLYPAFYLSSYQPVDVLKGEVTRGKTGSTMRKILIVFQFTVSVGIILSTLVIYSQMKHVRNKDMGFDSDNIVYFVGKGDVMPRYDAFKSELQKIPGVQHVGMSGSIPGYVNMGWGRVVDTVERRLKAIAVDPDFMEVYGLTLSQGRMFDTNGDINNAFILNQTAVDQFGLANPIGVRFANGRVIGVVNDFSFVSAHHKIEPLVMAWLSPDWYFYINLRLSGHNITQTMDQVDKVWKSFAPGFPFKPSFIDDAIGRLYEKEVRLSKLFLFFSFLAIFVAGMGLWGLALFTTRQRTKEVGVRKVLGASVSRIVLLLTSDFMRWVLLANIIAWPVSWYFLNRWLENFAYRIDIAWWMFLISALVAFVIAMITISFQSIRTAMANPVDSLRSE